jgi:hypothetical protein
VRPLALETRNERPLVDPDLVTDPAMGRPLSVELDGGADLLLVQSSSSRGDARAVQVPGHGPAVGGESISEFVDGGALLIAADQFAGSPSAGWST